MEIKIGLSIIRHGNGDEIRVKVGHVVPDNEEGECEAGEGQLRDPAQGRGGFRKPQGHGGDRGLSGIDKTRVDYVYQE